MAPYYTHPDLSQHIKITSFDFPPAGQPFKPALRSIALLPLHRQNGALSPRNADFAPVRKII